MNKLKKGMFAAQFPAGDKDPYWNDVLALIRCDGELVDLKGNCSLVADVGLKRFTEGDTHLASYSNLDSTNYARFLINSGFDPNADWTLEYTITPHEKAEIHASKYPSFISISSESSRVISIYSSNVLDYDIRTAFSIPTQRFISFSSITKNQPIRYSIQQRNGYGIVHKDGIRINNTNITAPIVPASGDASGGYYLNIFTLTSGGTSGLGTIEEIRLTQAARYGLLNYSIEPVFIQYNLPLPIYPKDPLYSDVVSLLRVQQGYMYDTKLNTVSPNTTNSVKGYYLDAFNFTGQSSDVRNITLLDPLIDEEFTLEFTLSRNYESGTKRVLSLLDSTATPQLTVDLFQGELRVTVGGEDSSTIPLGDNFNRIAIVYNGGVFSVYFNGLLYTITPTLSTTLDISSIKLSDETNPFTGTLEEIRLTKGIRHTDNYTPSEDIFPTRTLT